MSQTPWRRVLLVDDDPMVREVLAEALEFEGYHVTAAVDGHEALGLFAQGRYDVVVTDLSMPELSGWAVIERLREADREVPVIVISGVATGEDIERAEQIRVALLHKPTSIHHLRAAIESLPRR
jgi:CheY-like chemotaxis protein